ncbi:hypothetical protein Q760_15645 [Cellulomonas cellasea DSM 20118]|uniref:Uncharacterized protein n=1 Tax=Cellulomonas cellasea DSM 20118 TaxID=1408250 RepID=A0A0A0B7E4_9CELL|nr:hypothetical protein Q760_15645 [Cellulomonas cellasea DSM 20118]
MTDAPHVPARHDDPRAPQPAPRPLDGSRP